jgi:hypothetical protein
VIFQGLFSIDSSGATILLIIQGVIFLTILLFSCA